MATLVDTPGLVLHTTPYGESSVVARVFTRNLGLRAYLIKGVRKGRGSVKQNLLQPLSSLDMVVYESQRDGLQYIKEMSSRRPASAPDAVGYALRFFMTEVLYKALQSDDPMPSLWDYAEQAAHDNGDGERKHVPILYLLRVAHHLGIEPLDNYSLHRAYFDLKEGRFVNLPSETTLAPDQSRLLHAYLQPTPPAGTAPAERNQLLSALIAYFQLHIPGFKHFTSHEILHTILK